jgi:hypothetical protein
MQMAGAVEFGTVIAHKETLPIETVLRAKTWDKNSSGYPTSILQEQWPMP